MKRFMIFKCLACDFTYEAEAEAGATISILSIEAEAHSREYLDDDAHTTYGDIITRERPNPLLNPAGYISW